MGCHAATVQQDQRVLGSEPAQGCARRSVIRAFFAGTVQKIRALIGEHVVDAITTRADSGHQLFCGGNALFGEILRFDDLNWGGPLIGNTLDTRPRDFHPLHFLRIGSLAERGGAGRGGDRHGNPIGKFLNFHTISPG